MPKNSKIFKNLVGQPTLDKLLESHHSYTYLDFHLLITCLTWFNHLKLLPSYEVQTKCTSEKLCRFGRFRKCKMSRM